MTPVHLIGSGGFIGQAVQDEAPDGALICWSHHSNSSHHLDLFNRATWESLLAHQPRTAILLSWPGLPNYQQPFHISRNLPAVFDLINQLVNGGLQRLVIAGTCYEYGLQNGPLREDLCTEPVNLYAIAKDALRRSVAVLCEREHVSWCWLRIFYTHGAGQNPQSLLPSLKRAIAAGEDTFPMSSGRQIRDFVQVDSVARQLLTLANDQAYQGIYNGGSGIPRSVREVVEEQVEVSGSDIHIQRGAYPDRDDEPLAFWADMSRWSAGISRSRKELI